MSSGALGGEGVWSPERNRSCIATGVFSSVPEDGRKPESTKERIGRHDVAFVSGVGVAEVPSLAARGKTAGGGNIHAASAASSAELTSATATRRHSGPSESSTSSAARPLAAGDRNTSETGTTSSTAPGAVAANRLPLNLEYEKNVIYIERVPISFPFPQALNPQRQIMLRVIRAGREKQHALLESPTGTGRKIALLCSALAFQRAQTPEARRQIVYGVRSDQEAGQVIEELLRSPYAFARVVVLRSCGERGNTPVVGGKFGRVPPAGGVLHAAAPGPAYSSSKVGAQERALSSIESESRSIKSSSPQDLHLEKPSIASFVEQRDSQSLHKSDLDKGSSHNCLPTVDAVYIEDLKRKTFPRCSYYASHFLAGAADIVICPHNYILDLAIGRSSTGHRRNWSLEKGFVIMDEAHNVEELCRDVASLKLSWEELEALCTNLDKIAMWAADGTRNQPSELGGSGVYVDDGVSHSGCVSGGVGRASRRNNSDSAPSRGGAPVSSSKSKQQWLSGAQELREWLKFLAAELPASGKFGLGYPKTTEDLISEGFRGKRYGAGDGETPALAVTRKGARVTQKKYGVRLVPPPSPGEHVVVPGQQRSTHEPEDHALGERNSGRTTTATLAGTLPRMIDVCQELSEGILAEVPFFCQVAEPSEFLLVSLSTVARVQSVLERLRRMIEQPECYVVKIDPDRDSTTPPTCSRFGILCVFCMSAAAVVAPIASQVDSFILASGTLHPHDALVSELGEVFAARLQRKPPPLAAPHVISKDRFLLVPYVGTKYLGRGPSSCAKAAEAASFCFVRNMNARALEVEQQAQQQREQPFASSASCSTGITAEALADENFLEVIGRQILLTVVRSVPGGSGVLLFLPNKETVDRATRLWLDKVLCRESSHHLGISSGAAGGTSVDVERKAKEVTAYDGLPFRNRIVLAKSQGEFTTSVSNKHVITVLVCSYGDSASEGVEFRDSLCRLVVCVGIPFSPYYKEDIVVEEKKRYNDAAIACLGSRPDGERETTDSSSKEWQHPRQLSGSEWYEVQAYKAICQAAGRVIRHEKDYGCVVLFDGRWTGELLKKRLCAWLHQYGSGSRRLVAGGGKGTEGTVMKSALPETSITDVAALVRTLFKNNGCNSDGS